MSKTAMSINSLQVPAPKTRRVQSGMAGLLAGLLGLCCLADSRPARAELYTGLDAAFTLDALWGAGSLVAITGNAVTLIQGKPQRGWMYAGFIFGFVNLVMSPIIIVYGRGDIEKVPSDGIPVPHFDHGPPRPEIGFGLGAAHGVLGITSLALSIRNAVLWHRARVAESKMVTEPVASRTFTNLQLAPLVSRDSQGGALVGLVVSGQTF